MASELFVFGGYFSRLVLIVVALLVFAPDPVSAMTKRCSPAEKAEALEPASPSNKSVRLNCSLTLKKGERVTKQIRIWGANASGVQILCRGGRIGKAGPASIHFRKDLIQIRSAKLSDGRWSRPENVTIDGCEVNGAIRIMGLGQNGQAKNVKISSWRSNHTEFAQASAPRGITLRNLTVRGDGRIPVYFAPGVTHSKLVDSRIIGRSVSSGLYLDAESAHNVIRGNVFAVKTPREVISVDGEAHNIIENNRVRYADLGGVYVYRNCGEGGAARHQKPRFNQILRNTFSYEGTRSARPTIWLAFSSIARQVFLCPLDRAIPLGSGVDDRDFANNNKVIGNVFVRAPTDEVVRDAGKNNTVLNNRRIN